MIQVEITNDYLKNNLKKNSCFLTAIINKFYNTFDERDSKVFRKFKELTYEWLCNFLGLNCTEDNISCSITQALPFFKKYNISLFVYDPYLNLLYKCKPEKSHHSLYLLAKDSHLYQMNLNIKSLQQKVEQKFFQIKDCFTTTTTKNF